MTLGDWEREMATVSTEELVKMRECLLGLKTWPIFNQAFGWTGLFTVGEIIKVELKKRGYKPGNC